MRANAARAAHDIQRSKRSAPAVTTPSSMAHRPPGAVVRTPPAGVRGLAPSHRPPGPGARALFESRFAQDFSHVRVHTAERASSAPIAIGRTDDAFEREAEATADAISQGGTASLPQPLPRSVGHSTLVRMSGDGLLHGGGEALDHDVRRIMEPRLGFDLGGVRVHRGDAGATATTALNARAFTVGRDIAFAPGEFRPDTASGQRLLAHELTHVAQQAHAGTPVVQRQPKSDTDPWLTQVDDILPRNVGLLVHMNRIGQLTDQFTTDQLNELIGLIHANPGAANFTRVEAGVPGIFALNDTRIGKRLDVAAARFLLQRFPMRPPTPRKSDEKEAAVFSEAVVRDAYIRFHYNAILPEKDDPVPADLPNKIRENCIAIIHALAPKLFTDDSVVKKVEKSFKKLREKGQTYTIVHTGDALAGIGVADPRVEVKFKDAAGKTTNGDTEPTTLASSAWDKVMEQGRERIRLAYLRDGDHGRLSQCHAVRRQSAGGQDALLGRPMEDRPG